MAPHPPGFAPSIMTPARHNSSAILLAAPASRRISVTPLTTSAAALGIGVGGVALIGWTTDTPRLTTLGVGLDDPVKILTAAGLLAAGEPAETHAEDAYDTAEAMMQERRARIERAKQERIPRPAPDAERTTSTE